MKKWKIVFMSLLFVAGVALGTFLGSVLYITEKEADAREKESYIDYVLERNIEIMDIQQNDNGSATVWTDRGEYILQRDKNDTITIIPNP